MRQHETFIDSSVFVGLYLGDDKAADLVEEALNKGYLLVTNAIVFSETSFKVMYTLALQDGLKGIYDLRKNIDRYSYIHEKIRSSSKA